MIMITMKTMIIDMMFIADDECASKWPEGDQQLRQSPPYTSTMPTFYSGIPSTHLYIHVYNKLCVIHIDTQYTYILYITCKDINIVYSLSSCYTLCKRAETQLCIHSTGDSFGIPPFLWSGYGYRGRRRRDNSVCILRQACLLVA